MSEQLLKNSSISSSFDKLDKISDSESTLLNNYLTSKENKVGILKIIESQQCQRKKLRIQLRHKK